MAILAPSILAADFAALGEEIKKAQRGGATWLHIDVMDGVFVPSISFGFPIIQSIRPHTDLVFDTHLMIVDPEKYVDRFVEAGSDYVTIHVEACQCIADTLARIRANGAKAGISLNPDTPVEAIFPYLDQVDMVLVMTVHPGFGGQKYIDDCTPKITAIKEEIRRLGLDVLVNVDGGVKLDNVEKVLAAGADITVAGSAIFAGDAEENTRRFMSILE